MNLLQETEDDLATHGLSLSNIKWVGTERYTIPVDTFINIAGETEYDNGFGAQEVATDLIIVGDGWYMDRYEYDGSESWFFHTVPPKPDEEKNITRLASLDMWATLDEMNRPGGKDGD